MAGILDQAIRAIKESGQTPYRISQGSGVAQSQLSRLLNNEGGMSIENIERIMNYLNLEFVAHPKRTRRKAR